MRSRLFRLCAGLTLVALLCGSSCEDPDEPPPDCDKRVGADAKGIWTIHAHGKRMDCADDELNGTLEIDLSSFFVDGKPVATTDNNAGEGAKHEADAFVERIRRAQYTLEAGADAPAGLTFSGSVNTCQVTFRLRESLPRGQFHEYELDGFVDGGYRVYGRFTGTGPGSCRSEGKFEVQIR
jgi:hypothetical protein